MTKLITVFFATILTLPAFSQGPPEDHKVMEARARDFYKAVQSAEKKDWKKFVAENYSRELIDKPMKARVQGGGEATTTEAGGKTLDEKIDGKAMMFSRLHNDFGASKLSKLTASANQVELNLESDQSSAVVTLKFDANKPYLITGLGVEARQ
jgi:hypothetical protein